MPLALTVALVCIGAFVAIEVTSRALFLIHGRAQPVSKSGGYPLFPRRFFTVGLYGGSCAAGYLAEIDLADFLNTKGLRINGKPVYCTVMARPGWPLIGGQGQVACDLAGRFDLTIIWEGNNDYMVLNPRVRGNSEEVHLHFLEGQSQLAKVPLLSLRVLHLLKRLYSIALISSILKRIVKLSPISRSRLRPRVVESTSQVEAAARWFLDLKPITDNPVTELEDKVKVEEGYLAEVLRIADAVKVANRKMLVLTVANNDLWPPVQSKVTSTDFARVQESAADCAKLLQRSERDDLQLAADQCLKVLQDINEPPAVILFLLGKACVRLGDTSSARRYLDQAFEFDYGTTLGRSNIRARKVLLKGLEGNPTASTCDVAEEFGQFLSDPAEYEALFSDVQHPSTQGYWVVFKKLLKTLGELGYVIEVPNELSRAVHSTKSGTPVNDSGSNAISRKAMSVRRLRTAYGRMAWIVAAYRLHSDPEALSERASQAFSEWLELGPNEAPATIEFWRGMCLLGKDPSSALQALRRAKGLDYVQFTNLLRSPSDTGVPYGLIVENYAPGTCRESLPQEESWKVGG